MPASFSANIHDLISIIDRTAKTRKQAPSNPTRIRRYLNPQTTTQDPDRCPDAIKLETCRFPHLFAKRDQATHLQISLCRKNDVDVHLVRNEKREAP